LFKPKLALLFFLLLIPQALHSDCKNQSPISISDQLVPQINDRETGFWIKIVILLPLDQLGRHAKEGSLWYHNQHRSSCGSQTPIPAIKQINHSDQARIFQITDQTVREQKEMVKNTHFITQIHHFL